MAGGIGTNHLGVNLSYTKFLFITPRGEDEATLAKLRAVAATVARGYFNDFEAQGGRDGASQDTVQFLQTQIKEQGLDLKVSDVPAKVQELTK